MENGITVKVKISTFYDKKVYNLQLKHLHFTVKKSKLLGKKNLHYKVKSLHYRVKSTTFWGTF